MMQIETERYVGYQEPAEFTGKVDRFYFIFLKFNVKKKKNVYIQKKNGWCENRLAIFTRLSRYR